MSTFDSHFPPFQILTNSILQVFPDVAIAPGLMVGVSDSRHYQPLCRDAVYRFQPVKLTKADISRFHGYNERITVENFLQVVEFYNRLIHNADHFALD